MRFNSPTVPSAYDTHTLSLRTELASPSVRGASIVSTDQQTLFGCTSARNGTERHGTATETRLKDAVAYQLLLHSPGAMRRQRSTLDRSTESWFDQSLCKCNQYTLRRIQRCSAAMCMKWYVEEASERKLVATVFNELARGGRLSD